MGCCISQDNMNLLSVHTWITSVQAKTAWVCAHINPTWHYNESIDNMGHLQTSKLPAYPHLKKTDTHTNMVCTVVYVFSNISILCAISKRVPVTQPQCVCVSRNQLWTLQKQIKCLLESTVYLKPSPDHVQLARLGRDVSCPCTTYMYKQTHTHSLVRNWNTHNNTM